MVDPSAAAIRFALYADVLVLFGLATFLGLSLDRGERRLLVDHAPRRTLLALASGAILISGLGLASVTAQMSGTPITAVDGPSIATVLSQTSFGAAWIVQSGALVLTLASVLAARPNVSLVAIFSGVALATLAWGGHGVMQQDARGFVHLAADIVHLIAAAAWLGSLAGFLLLLAASAREPRLIPVTHRALEGFSSIGTGLVGTIILTGLINAWFTVGLAHLGSLLASDYGVLLLAKLILVMMMLALASLNRFRFTPALGKALEFGLPADALAALRFSILAEALLGAAVLAVVAWLGLLEPPYAIM